MITNDTEYQIERQSHLRIHVSMQNRRKDTFEESTVTIEYPANEIRSALYEPNHPNNHKIFERFTRNPSKIVPKYRDPSSKTSYFKVR